MYSKLVLSILKIDPFLSFPPPLTLSFEIIVIWKEPNEVGKVAVGKFRLKWESVIEIGKSSLKSESMTAIKKFTIQSSVG